MTTKTAAKSTAKSTAKKTGSPAAEALKARTAMKETALSLTPAQLVERITKARFAEDKGTQQVEHFRNLYEAAKMEASNQRVLLARSCYLLAAHPEVGGKKINYAAAARAVVGPVEKWEAADDKDTYAKTVDKVRVWLTVQAKAGEALEAKALVWNQGAPTEAERAIVEKSHDETVRAASAKKNEKVRNKSAGKGEEKGKGEDKGGIIPPNVETAIPTAEGLLAALETSLRNFRKFNGEARLTKVQVTAAEELLTALMGELEPETALEVPAEDA